MNRAPRVLFLFVDAPAAGCYDPAVSEKICSGERIEDLQLKGLRIIRRLDRPGYSTDSVLLADFARLKPHSRVCDLGCGIGILPLLLIGREPSLRLLGIELQADLAALACRSARLNGLQDRIEIWTGDLREVRVRLQPRGFEAVVSNPPYHRTSAGGPEKQQLCCSFEDLAAAAAWLLKPGGRMFVCVPAGAMLSMADALRAYRLEPKRLRLVVSLPQRAPYLCLIEARQGARPGLRVEPSLTLLDDVGRMSGEARRIYHMEEELKD